LTSGSISVKKAPAILHAKKIQRTAGVPMSLLSELNAKADIIAPAFPDAADIPCAKAR
jgi:hypothetical protein